MATGQAPLHLEWPNPSREIQLADGAQHARFDEVVIREGGPADVLTYIHGALPVDHWPDIVLPQDIRTAWAPVMEAGRRRTPSTTVMRPIQTA
jgi:hypothetical protein